MATNMSKEWHKHYEAEKKQARKAAGLCYDCGVAPRGKTLRCDPCREWKCNHALKRSTAWTPTRRAYQLRLKLQAFEAYGGTHCFCPGCDVTEPCFLSIDHIENNGAEHRRKDGGARNIYHWLRKHNYPSGFQVLCMNCQFGKKCNQGVCPHELERNGK